MTDEPYITFGAQMGDERSANAVSPHLRELRRLLEKHCKGPYSSAVDEFAPILRVDGDIWYWEFEGCDRLRWQKKDRFITIDIGVPRHRWEGVTPEGIRKYLMKNLKEAMELIVKRLKKEKADIDEKQLFNDLSIVENKFLYKK